MGQIKVFVQELGLKQGVLADTNMDYLALEWPGTPNLKVDANFNMFPQNAKIRGVKKDTGTIFSF